MKVGKTELVEKVAEQAKLTKKQAKDAVDAVLDIIVETVADGDSVGILGFGTFSSRHQDAREGKNPATGEKITIPERNYPTFKAGETFKTKVNS